MHRSLFALILLLLPTLATAVDFTVTRLDDPPADGCLPGDCTLREAVIAAEAGIGMDRILLPPGTITLTYDDSQPFNDNQNGPLLLETEVQIIGAGRTQTTITGTANLPLVLGVGIDGDSAVVTLEDLSIANVVPLSAPYGPVFVGETGSLTVRRFGMHDNSGPVAGIFSGGQLRVFDAVFERNTANGAVVYAARGPVTVTGTQFIDNTTASGALLIADFLDHPLGQMDLRNNLFRGNLSSEQAAGLTVFVAAGLNQLDISDSVFEDNQSGGDGGAVLLGYDPEAANTTRLDIIADGVRFTGNRANGACGALQIEADSSLNLLQPPSLTMDLAVFDANQSDSFGGALCTVADTTITRSRFAGNSAASHGGAIVAGGSTMRIERSTLSDNEAGSTGGALFSLGTLELEHSTVDGNSAGSQGGGLMLSGLTENRIARSTLAGNRANGSPNALRLASSPPLPATLRLSGSILQGGCSLTDPSAVTASSYSIESPGDSCALSSAIGSFNQRNVSAVSLALGALDDNGGPTLTRMPGDDSAARNPPGLSSGNLCARIDQRGYVATDTQCDTGAVEVDGVAPEPPTPEVFTDGFE